MGRGQRSGPSGDGNGVGQLGPGIFPFSGLGVRGSALTSFPCPVHGCDATGPTCVDIMVPVQGGELLAIVPGKGVTSVAMVAPQPQLIILALRLQAEAGIFCEDLAARPVFHGHQQFVVALVRQPVNVLQAQPVLAVNVPKPLLGKTWASISEEYVVRSASRARLSAAQHQTERPGNRQSRRQACI